LILILIVLVGGPIALGLAVSVPAWLAWTGISFWLPILFWGLAAIAGAAALLVLGLVISAMLPESKKTTRVCPQCGTRGSYHHQFCQKCFHDFGWAEPVKLPEWPPKNMKL